jgi:hypothetical protein
MDDKLSAWLMAAVAGFVLGALVIGSLVEYTIHQEASNTPCAQYNPVTGNFEWIGEQNGNQ